MSHHRTHRRGASARRAGPADRARPAEAGRHRLVAVVSELLLDSSQHCLSCPTSGDRRSWVGPPEFVSRQSDSSLLLLPLCVRVVTCLDIPDEGFVVDRVRARVRDDSLHRRFVFLGSTLVTVVSREFGPARTRKQIRKAAIAVEDNVAFWSGTKWLLLGAIWARKVDRNPRPGSHQVFGGLANCAARRQR
jgi:hypothetical protein